MFRQHDLVPSRAMDRPMHLWRFGDFGAPVIVFPSAGGMAHEWDAHGMVDALAPLIEAGKIKLYCTETNVSQAWTARDGDPRHRIWLHRCFLEYVTQELVAFVREDCRTPDIPIAATGTSLGAWYSANFALHYPETFRYALCMSGMYDLSDFVGDFRNTDVYYSNPLAYVPGLDGTDLERVRRRTWLTLVCGQGAWEDGNIEETRALGAALASKRIGHDLELWGHDVSHGWEWWRRQAPHYLGMRFGG